MKKFLISLVVVVGWFLINPDVGADLLRMKNGKVIEGKFLGGTEHEIHFRTDDNAVTVYPVKDILTITFITFSAPSSQKIQTPQPEQPEITIKRNTRLSVRIEDSLDTGMSRKGDWFDATLITDLVVDDIVVAPQGTTFKGQVIKSEQGMFSSGLVITLRELILKQKVIPIFTTTYAIWDRVPESSDAVKTYRQGRLLEIPSQTVLEFKTTKPITIDLMK